MGFRSTSAIVRFFQSFIPNDARCPHQITIVLVRNTISTTHSLNALIKTTRRAKTPAFVTIHNTNFSMSTLNTFTGILREKKSNEKSNIFFVTLRRLHLVFIWPGH